MLVPPVGENNNCDSVSSEIEVRSNLLVSCFLEVGGGRKNTFF